MADDLPPGADASTLTKISADLPPGADASTLTSLAPTAPSLSEAIKAGQDYPVMGEGLPPVAGPTGAKVLKDLGIGAAESVTGLGELVPGVAPYAAKGTRYLHGKVDYPAVEELGTLAPFLLGGDVLGGAKAGAYLVPKAAEGAGFLARAGLDTLRGGVSGAVGGAEAGLAKPTGKAGSESFPEKGAAMAAAIPAGALIGGGLGLGGEALSTAGTAAKKMWGTEARKAAEELRGEAGASVKGVAEKEVANVQDSAHEISQVGAALDQATDEAQIAKASADAAKENVDRLVEDLRKNPTQDAIAFGDKIRALAKATYDKRVAARKRISKLGEAVESAGDQPIVKTDSIRNYLDQWSTETTDPNEQSIIAYVRNAIGGEKPGPINVKSAESTRTTLAALERAKDMSAIGKSEGRPAKAAYRIGQIANLLKDSIKKAAPQVSSAVTRFRQMSRPLDPFERTGPRAGAGKTDALSDDFITEQGKLVESLLKRTKEGSSPFELLIQEDPKLKNDMRQYLQFKLFGKAQLPRDVSPEKIDKFVADNERVLRQTGLLRDFVGIRNKVSAATDAVEQLKTVADVKQGNVDAIKQVFADAKVAGKVSEDAEKKYGDLFAKMSDAKIIKTADVAKEADKIADAMRQDNYLNRDQYLDMRQKIADVRQKYEDAATARKEMGRLIGEFVLAYFGYETYRFIRARI